MPKGTKLSLGEFLGDAASQTSNLPSGPDPSRDPSDNGRRHFQRGGDRESRKGEGGFDDGHDRSGQMNGDRSMNNSQWRRPQAADSFGDRPGSFRRNDSYDDRRQGGGGGSGRGQSFGDRRGYGGNVSRDEPPVVSERPAEMRLKLAPRTLPLESPPPLQSVKTPESQLPKPISVPSKPKPNPFGQARAVDTTQREREIEKKMSTLRVRSVEAASSQSSMQYQSSVENVISAETTSSIKDESAHPDGNAIPGPKEDTVTRPIGRWTSLRQENARSKEFGRDGGSHRDVGTSYDRREMTSNEGPPSSNAYQARFRSDFQRDDDRNYQRRDRDRLEERFERKGDGYGSGSFTAREQQDQHHVSPTSRETESFKPADIPQITPIQSEPSTATEIAIEKEQNVQIIIEVAPIKSSSPLMAPLEKALPSKAAIEPILKKQEKTVQKPKAKPKMVHIDAKDIILENLDMAVEVLSTNKKDSELADLVKSRKGLVGGSILLSVLRNEEKPLTGIWASDNQFGLAIKELAPPGSHKEQMYLLYAVQMFAHEKGFPKTTKDYLFQTLFALLYSQDFCEIEAYDLWKDDISDSTPGKQTAIVQSLTFFQLLEAQKQDEYSDEED